MTNQCYGHMSGCHVRDGSGICPNCKQPVGPAELPPSKERDVSALIAELKAVDNRPDIAQIYIRHMCLRAAGEMERLRERIADLQQFHDWALPQITPPSSSNEPVPAASKELVFVLREAARFSFADERQMRQSTDWRAADFIERLQRELREAREQREAIRRERMIECEGLRNAINRLQRLIGRVVEWQPTFPVEASLLDELAAAAQGVSARGSRADRIRSSLVDDLVARLKSGGSTQDRLDAIEMLQELSRDRASSACPICGADTPHHHGPDDICAWLQKQAGRFNLSVEVFDRTEHKEHIEYLQSVRGRFHEFVKSMGTLKGIDYAWGLWCESPNGKDRLTPPPPVDVPFERGCYVLMEMMEAYERRVRSACTAAEIENRPWECLEWIAAADYLKKVWPPYSAATKLPEQGEDLSECRCKRSDGITRFNINCVTHGKAP